MEEYIMTVIAVMLAGSIVLFAALCASAWREASAVLKGETKWLKNKKK